MKNPAPAPLQMACNRLAADAKREAESAAPASLPAANRMAGHALQPIRSPSAGSRKEASGASGFIFRVSS